MPSAAPVMMQTFPLTRSIAITPYRFATNSMTTLADQYMGL